MSSRLLKAELEIRNRKILTGTGTDVNVDVEKIRVTKIRSSARIDETKGNENYSEGRKFVWISNHS